MGFGGRSLGFPGDADGEPCGWGLGCSVVAADVLGEAGGELEVVAGAFVGGEPGALAALAGDDGEALDGTELEAESWVGFVTEGALVIGGGLGTGGFVTEAAFWTGLGF